MDHIFLARYIGVRLLKPLFKGSPVKNSVREIELGMQQNWPECAKTMSFSLLKVSRLHNLFNNGIDQCIEQFQLQHADFIVLTALRRSPLPYCLSPTELYQSIFFSSGGLTKVLVRLAEAGLIERLENPHDKRSKLVQLNQKGKQLVETIMPTIQQQGRQLLAGLSENESLQLESLLQKVLDHNESRTS